MPRLSKITTKTGDDGTTGLVDGSRLAKNEPRIHLLGEVDELNAFIGMSISFMQKTDSQPLIQIQHDLFDIGAEICQPGKQLINDDYIKPLEQLIDTLNQQLPPLKEFILPGGSTLVAQLHICRTVCRRCERYATALNAELNPATLQYLNRLSDFFFVFARYIAKQTACDETFWQSEFSRNS